MRHVEEFALGMGYCKLTLEVLTGKCSIHISASCRLLSSSIVSIQSNHQSSVHLTICLREKKYTYNLMCISGEREGISDVTQF